jgi:hypothetical protein
LKTTSFLVFHSHRMVSKISDLIPFCRIGLAPTVAEANRPGVKILISPGHAA